MDTKQWIQKSAYKKHVDSFNIRQMSISIGDYKSILIHHPFQIIWGCRKARHTIMKSARHQQHTSKKIPCRKRWRRERPAETSCIKSPRQNISWAYCKRTRNKPEIYSSPHSPSSTPNKFWLRTTLWAQTDFLTPTGHTQAPPPPPPQQKTPTQGGTHQPTCKCNSIQP